MTKNERRAWAAGVVVSGCTVEAAKQRLRVKRSPEVVAELQRRWGGTVGGDARWTVQGAQAGAFIRKVRPWLPEKHAVLVALGWT